MDFREDENADKPSKTKEFGDVRLNHRRVTISEVRFLELKKVNELFNDCYKLYKNFSQSTLSDDDWYELVKISGLIHKKYNTEFSKIMVIAVIDEIERMEKVK